MTLTSDISSNASIAEATTAAANWEKEYEALREHIRKQAMDIMTLGALVYADEDTTWKARAEAAEARIAELEKALKSARDYIESMSWTYNFNNDDIDAVVGAALSNRKGAAESPHDLVRKVGKGVRG